MTPRRKAGVPPKELAVHPGVVLREEYLEPLGISSVALARRLGVAHSRITGVLRGERRLTVETALRLARFLGTSPKFWLALQQAYDLRMGEDEFGRRVRATVVPWERLK